MKLLIAILFCISIGMGQTMIKCTTTDSITTFEQQQKRALLDDRWLLVQHPRHDWEGRKVAVDSCQPLSEAEILQRLLSDRSIGVFLALYSRYEKDCWDDSTEIGSTWGWDSTASNGQRDVMKLIRRNFIHYRQPTFPGFVEWLRRQYGKAAH